MKCFLPEISFCIKLGHRFHEGLRSHEGLFNWTLGCEDLSVIKNFQACNDKSLIRNQIPDEPQEFLKGLFVFPPRTAPQPWVWTHNMHSQYAATHLRRIGSNCSLLYLRSSLFIICKVFFIERSWFIYEKQRQYFSTILLQYVIRSVYLWIILC